MLSSRTNSSTFQKVLLALLFWIAVVNYFDRQSLSVVAPLLQRSLQLSDTGYGHVVTAFLFASAIAYALTGVISDKLGTARSMALFVGVWSLAEGFTTFAHSLLTLAIARFLLGLGEPGLWVAAPKAVSEFFQRELRSTAIGLYTLGASVGAVIALPIIVYVTTHLPWRSIFLIDAVAGLLWLPLWWACMRRSGGHRIAAEPPASAISIADRPSAPRLMLSLLRRPVTLRLLLARGITDPVWYFYLFWFPKYLASERHLSLAQVARTGWIVYLAAGIGTVLGGVLPRLLSPRNTAGAAKQVTRGYFTVMVLCAVVMPLSPFAALTPSVSIAIVLAGCIALAHMAWLINLTSLIVEIFPQASVATAAGLIAAGSATGGMISSEIIGHAIRKHGYTPLFVLMAFLHPAALALLWSLRKQSTSEPAPSTLPTVVSSPHAG